MFNYKNQQRTTKTVNLVLFALLETLLSRYKSSNNNAKQVTLCRTRTLEVGAQF